MYINGTPISGNSHDGDYHSEYRFLRSDIAPLLIPNSTNWLYVNASDYGVLAALIFSATINTHGAVTGAPSISPDHGGNTGMTTVTIIASGFQPGAQLKLTGIGADINGTNTIAVNANILTSTLALTGALPGLRSVVVTDPDGSTVTIPSAFTVQAGGTPTVSIQKIATPAVLGRNQTYFITVTNTGTVDSGTIPVIEDLDPMVHIGINQPSGKRRLDRLRKFSRLERGGSYNAFVEWDLPSVPAGGSTLLAYTVTLDPSFPLSKNVIGPACIEIAKAGCEIGEVACFSAAATVCIEEGPVGVRGAC